jgi:hypothetical protein
MKSISDDWLRSHWRPMMAVVYMMIILFDFMVAPIFWSLIQVWGSGSVAIQWSPLTLIAGGIFHAAMGAVLGISAFTRGQEKLKRLETDYQEGYNDNGRN